MSRLKMLTNPVLRGKDNVGFNNPAGNVMKEVLDQEVKDNVAGGYDSDGLGNQGKHCSVTVECITLCNWVSWGGACS